ncbi:hypothetical protein RUND412_011046 [Rhizina undulata]
MDWDNLLFNVASFICALFVLEFGADKFVDNTAVVARRLGVPQVLVALLTAGAEWEELAVIIASLSQRRTSLALGNVLGSTISNILGAFSLGLLFHSDRVTFDRSSKIYAGTLLMITTGVTGVVYTGRLTRVTGWALIGVFVVYVGSIAYGIRKGSVSAPELSDSSSDEDTSDGENTADEGIRRDSDVATEESTLLPRQRRPRPRPRSTLSHVLNLFLGFLAVSLSGYVLSHTTSSLATTLNLSPLSLGMALLSLATTLPEKLIAIVSGSRGHVGILVANTVGSNIFLLTLCLGLVLVGAPDGAFDAGAGVETAEMAVVWGATVALFGAVWGGAGRVVGAGMVVAYLAFLVMEFGFVRRG